MEFKVNLALFKATEDSLKARYGDKYDPSKKYPQYNGTMQVCLLYTSDAADE